MTQPLKLMVWDKTCRTHYWKRRWPLGLSHAWQTGSWLYRALFRLDAARGVSSWAEALEWLATVKADAPVAEIQFWGHGKWGRAMVDHERLGTESLAPDHAHHDGLAAVRDRLVGPDALWWFRTCETFGAEAGHDFARAFSRFMGCRVAGHTYVIGPWQSGLHLIEPGDEPHWDPAEGLKRGTPAEPRAARYSKRTSPYTISCLGGSIPDGW